MPTPVRGKDGKLHTQANCSPYGLISFGSSAWQNAEETTLQQANQMQCYGTGPARLAFSKAKGFTGDWLSCRFPFVGHLRGVLEPPSNNSKRALTMECNFARLKWMLEFNCWAPKKGGGSVCSAPPINPPSFIPTLPPKHLKKTKHH